ncbi:NAD/NADP-dependent octopine/nopaline dehydrogenase family protein [Aliiruegeria lutimaris]|uniref:2-dehydropantoate 2-reductase n=1 Tax=Aliiruegeria lutimaris TaxID=571298 RepID=A0A1G8T481_9RHOB|nr:NAD/NADP-dependent octopine/nopaline dehydrogenase family protein [Aliiruegeria lutimaris]SDJ36306.1 ketopantoate reductase [Aliiruegeria lutimaris]
MKISVLGGGPVGQTYCALLLEAGHHVRLYSQSGRAEHETRFFGAINMTKTITPVRTLPEAVAFADALLIARQAPGLQPLLDAIAPLLKPSQSVIFSAELSFASFHLARKLRVAGSEARLISWSTTAATAHRRPEGIRVGTLRGTVDMASSGNLSPLDAMALCRALFGDVFRDVGSPLAIGLSNLNPEVHLANVLGNLTRIELAEDWDNYGGITPAVGRIIEELDAERRGLAARFGLDVRSVLQHFQLTFPDIEIGNVHETTQRIAARGRGPKGPVSTDTRYITEDLPYGIVPLCELGRRRNIPLPLHEAGVRLLSVGLGADFTTENGMIGEALDEICGDVSD